MNENNFMKVEDVAKELGISISHSYKIMQQLNKELKAKGYVNDWTLMFLRFFVTDK